MKGAIPIPYIVAAILAIIVIALIGYWLFVSLGLFGEKLSEDQCNTRIREFCYEWRYLSNFNKTDETKIPAGGWENFEPRCKYLNWGNAPVEKCEELGIKRE
ncbi:MAG: hypothetical protein QW609_02205 [Candidatus Aenigmatarchaeota archaeon]